MLSKEETDKALGQFNLQLNGLLELFNTYGMHVYFPEVKKEITRLSLLLHERLSGKDVLIK